MIHITPSRSLISDRFPVASFQVKAPPEKCFEIACATDARLFHPSYRGQRTSRNFYASGAAGPLRARTGDATWLLPPQKLKEFAGSTRLYYALGVYGSPHGEDSVFSIAPDRLDGVPYVQIAPDFTGRTLARMQDRSGPARSEDSRYGGGRQGERGGDGLAWGGDAAFARYGGRGEEDEDGQPYDEQPYEAASSVALMDQEEEPPGYEDAPDMAAHGVGGLLEEPEPPGVEHASELSIPAGEQPVPLAPAGAQPAANRAAAPAYAARQRVPIGRYGGQAATARRPGGFARRTARGLSGIEADEFVPPGRAEDYSDADLLEVVALSTGSEAATTEAAAVPFTDAEKRLILYAVARFESGLAPAEIGDPERMARAYGACNRNTDGAGLSYGFIQFTQKSGNLGALLRRLYQRDAETFARVFGAGDELLATTTAAGAEERMAPVAGENLWGDTWVGRFRAAAKVPAFQEEQDRLAIEKFVAPNLRLAALLGFDTDRALALLIDRCIQQGNGGGRSWVVSRVGPLHDEALRRQALDALGFEHLRDFQSAAEGLDVDGKWGPMTHAAMVASLRALGDRSPIAVPTREEMLDALVAQAEAEGRSWASRPRALREERELLRDTRYVL